MSDNKKEMSVEDFILWCEKYYNMELYDYQKKLIKMMWDNPNKELYLAIPRRSNFTNRSNIIYVE